VLRLPMHDSSPTMMAPEDSTTKGSFQLGTAMGQPDSMSRGVPAGATPWPAKIRCSSSLASEHS